MEPGEKHENVTDNDSLSPNKKIRSDNGDVSDNDNEKVQPTENCVSTLNGSKLDDDVVDCNGLQNSDDKELIEPIGDSALLNGNVKR